MVVLAATTAGCLPDPKMSVGNGDLLIRVDQRREPFIVSTGQPRHRLIYDGSWPDCLHLHHVGNPNVLLIPRATLNSPELPDEILSWLEALHKGWLP